MIRRFNYTGRKKINKEYISINIYRNPGKEYEFSASLLFDNLGLPPEAAIFIETYKGQYFYIRFPFGTIGDQKYPPNRTIMGLDDPEGLLFRVKVVDQTDINGKLIAAANRIIPTDITKEPSNRISILPVESCDLGNVIWRLRYEGEEHPVLEITDKIDGFKERVRSDLEFQGLVFPEIVRQILRYIIVDQKMEHPSDDDDDGFWGLWLRFACDLPGVLRPPSEDESLASKEQWIESAVESFSRYHNYLHRYSKHFKKEQLT